MLDCRVIKLYQSPDTPTTEVEYFVKVVRPHLHNKVLNPNHDELLRLLELLSQPEQNAGV